MLGTDLRFVGRDVNKQLLRLSRSIIWIYNKYNFVYHENHKYNLFWINRWQNNNNGFEIGTLNKENRNWIKIWLNKLRTNLGVFEHVTTLTAWR